MARRAPQGADRSPTGPVQGCQRRPPSQAPPRERTSAYLAKNARTGSTAGSVRTINGAGRYWVPLGVLRLIVADPPGRISEKEKEDLAVFQMLSIDQRDQFERLFNSWDIGWRSLLLEQLRLRRPSDELVKPPRDEQTIVLVTQGRCEIQSHSGGQWRSVHVHAGRIRMTAPMQPTHSRWRTAPSTPCETLRLSVSAAEISRLVEQTWDRDPGAVVLPDSLDMTDPVLGQTMLGLLRAARDGVGDLYAESAKTFLVTHLLVRHAGLATPRGPARGDARIHRARTFLRRNLDLPLTLDQIAAEAGMSEYHFLRVFRAHTGETPFRYLTRLRVEQAQHELTHSADTVAEIAARCGFARATHFATAFRRQTGVSPSAWRRLEGDSFR